MYLLKHFRKELVLQQDLHACAFTITSIRSFIKTRAIFFSVGAEGGYIAVSIRGGQFKYKFSRMYFLKKEYAQAIATYKKVHCDNEARCSKAVYDSFNVNRLNNARVHYYCITYYIYVTHMRYYALQCIDV